nr:uncharacterized protein LOC128695229 isoform X2 [Cherax quadricarinatus]
MVKHGTQGTEGQGFVAAIFYGVCSASMAFLNKGVINSYEFPFPFFIMACQMFVTIIILELLVSLGKINLPLYTWRSARMFLAPSLGYAFHASLSLMALQGMNIPMYGAVKRCTPLVNLILAVVILRRPFPSLTMIASILIITTGCFVADIGFHMTLWTLVVMGAVLNYSLFLCTALNSALTTSLVSVAKSAIQTLIGFFVFGGVKYHPLIITGIVMNTVGGFLYSYTKYNEGKTKTFHKDENFNKVTINGNSNFSIDHSVVTPSVTKDEHVLSEIKRS